jgi:hypothetical protein
MPLSSGNRTQDLRGPGPRFSGLTKPEKLKAICYGTAGALIAVGYGIFVILSQHLP